MRVTFAVCADRAVGFGAALLGLALLSLTARHLLAPIAPIATYESPSALVTRVPAVAAHAVVTCAVLRPAVVHRSRSAAPRAHASARTEVGMRGGTVVRSVNPARGAVRATSSVAPSHVGPVRLAPARVATAQVAPTHVAFAGHRRSERSRFRPPSIVPTKRRPHTRPPASAAFRMPARFDVRPALVAVPDAAVAALPADDALPTIDARKRRR